MSAPYGHCPHCSALGVSRERRPNGNDECEKGHTYPSLLAIEEPTVVSESKRADSLALAYREQQGENDILRAKLEATQRERDHFRDAWEKAQVPLAAAVKHTMTLEQQNVALLRWQAVASDAHVDHLCNVIRALAVADETPRVFRDLSAVGVEEEVRRAFAAERINREKSEASAREWRKKAEDAEALHAEVERLREFRNNALHAGNDEVAEEVAEERAAVVAWLYRDGCHASAERIERGEHRREEEP